MGDIVGVGAFTIGDYLAIFNRQKWRMLMVAAVIATISAAVVAYWPATYRSTATILIREADVPPNLVPSATSVFADERVQAMQQQVITTQNLTAIIEKLNLYPDERSTEPMSQIIDEMRGNIGLSIISADATAKSPRDVKAAIAFTLWFDANSPSTAQQVANELVTLYLSQRQLDREQRTTSTKGFLNAESMRIQRDVQALEAQIESFKGKYAGYLPEDRTLNTQLLDRTESQLLDLTRQARSLRERESMLQSQLAITPKYLPVAATQDSTSPDAQLSMLEGKLESLRAKYGDKHPDVVALNRQIDALKSAGATSRPDSAALTLQIQSLTADLESMRRQYGPTHPDVAALERELRTMKARLATAPGAGTAQSAANPAYAQLQIQLSSAESELAAVADQQRAMEDKQEKIEERLSKAPMVERDYVALRRDYDAAVDRYLEIKNKESDAELAANLETEGGGETLSLTEPPVEPIAPIRPNREIMLAIGLVAAIAGAGLIGILCDALDGRVHGWRQVAAITGQTPFATIPVIRTVADRRRSRAKEASLFVLAASSAAVALVYVHYVLFPMEGLWTDLIGRLGLTQWMGAAVAQAML
jgi:protein tyrosine kinase modulator